MGYYVRIAETASNFKIKKENFERGYEIMCDLNKLFNSSCGSLCYTMTHGPGRGVGDPSKTENVFPAWCF